MSLTETEHETERVSFQVDGRRVTVSSQASEDECAALACAVISHLRDEARTTGRNDDTDPTVPPWKLGERLGPRHRRPLPVRCRRGEEWKLAGRGSRW